MALDYEESKTKLLEGLKKKSKSKTKFYFKDLAKILDAKPREAKKVVNRMITEGHLEYCPAAAPPCTEFPVWANRRRLSTRINKHGAMR